MCRHPLDSAGIALQAAKALLVLLRSKQTLQSWSRATARLPSSDEHVHVESSVHFL